MRSLVRNLIRELSGAPWGPGILWLRASFLIFWRARVCACVRRQMQNIKLDKGLYKAWLARSLARSLAAHPRLAFGSLTLPSTPGARATETYLCRPRKWQPIGAHATDPLVASPPQAAAHPHFKLPARPPTRT